MDILYRAGWNDEKRVPADLPEPSGAGRLAVALCVIALLVGILENARDKRSDGAHLALSTAHIQFGDAQ